MYFAEDFNTGTNVLLNYISNGRDATTTGTIAKITESGNGASDRITYISGGTGATITFPTGSILTRFTILRLTRYNESSRRRILSGSSGNWL
jgi:3-phosphoglycerate kinase